MKNFTCNNCQTPVYFENEDCQYCKQNIGFSPFDFEMKTKSSQDKLFEVGNKKLKYCKNYEHNACNWLVESTNDTLYCVSCNLNRTIPNLSFDDNVIEWKRLEVAKRRLVYSLLKLKLPIVSKSINQTRLNFDFLSSNGDLKPGQSYNTGHSNGTITINIDEADSIHREKMRLDMEEKYRTLIGHLRHEVGHYYWDLLILEEKESLQQFREIFGDERTDYNESLKKHYKNKNSKNWQNSFISCYASAHPWEDWAETWSHYLHIIDLIETAISFNILKGDILDNRNPHLHNDFDSIINAIVPLTVSINALNRGMGQPDIYPFVINDMVVSKLRFIHKIILNNSKN